MTLRCRNHRIVVLPAGGVRDLGVSSTTRIDIERGAMQVAGEAVPRGGAVVAPGAQLLLTNPSTAEARALLCSCGGPGDACQPRVKRR